MIQKTRNIKQEVYIIQIGISPTLTTMDKGGHKQPYILVREATKKGLYRSNGRRFNKCFIS